MKNWTQRLNFFLVVWLTMFSCLSSRAQIFFNVPANMVFSEYKFPEPVDFGKARQIISLPVKRSTRLVSDLYNGFLYSPRMEATVLQNTYHQPANLYYLQSGYFCKREWELEKTTHVPFRFRLGSLAACDALEGKH